MSDGVIGRKDWLEQRARQALEAGEADAPEIVERYLGTLAGDDRAPWYRQLGEWYFARGDVTQASSQFGLAIKHAGASPQLLWSIGRCKAVSGSFGGALVDFFHAIALSDTDAELVEYLGSAAWAWMHLGENLLARDMVLGALERAPENPSLLNMLGRIYEAQGMLHHAVDARRRLLSVVNGDGQIPTQTIEAHDEIRSELEDLHRKIRQRFVVVDNDEPWPIAEAGLSRLALPSGLHALVERLNRRSRAAELLSTAQSLWARAFHDRFDVHLGPPRLAAAVEWISLRYRWADMVSMEDLASAYEVDAESLQAAVRLLVGRFEVGWSEEGRIKVHLFGEDRKRFEAIEKSLLYGIQLESLDQNVVMLG